MTMNKFLGGVALAALLAGAAQAQTSTLGAGDFTGQDVASEFDGTLAGDVIIDFALDGVFAGMGAGGAVTATFTLTNATFSSTVPVAAWTAASDADCDFGSPSLGGGAGATSVEFENQGQLNQCATVTADDGTITLPIEVTSNGSPVSVNVTFTATADAGTYTDSDEDLDLMDFAQGMSFDIALGTAGAGLFDADGDALVGTGIIGTVGATLAAVDIDAAGTALADAQDIAASGTLLVEFPSGAEGIGSVDAGFGACTQGVAPNDNQFSCALSGANLSTIEGADQDVTITDDADPLTFVTPQVPTATLSLVGQANFTPVGTSDDLQEVEIDDGLDTSSIVGSNFAWVRFGAGGTESNFRIQMDDAAEVARVTEVRVTVAEGNGVAADTYTLLPGQPGVGFRTLGSTITFNSAALGVAAGASGNADITDVTVQYEEGNPVAPLGGTEILRQLVNRAPGSFVATPGLESDN